VAAPNIISLTKITGKTAVQSVTTVATDIVTNSAASGKVMKVNSLTVANIDGTNAADITVDLYRSATTYKISSAITVPAGTTLTLITKDLQIYVEEGDSLRCTASANGDLQAVCSYEELS